MAQYRCSLVGGGVEFTNSDCDAAENSQGTANGQVRLSHIKQ